MEISPFTLLGGLLAGFASSLHCAGMCSGISASLMFTLAPDDRQAQRRVVLQAQLGRIAAYIAAGVVLASAGSSLYFAADRAVMFDLMRWAAAFTLLYIGFSVAGWAPALAGLDRAGSAVLRRLPLHGGARISAASPFLAGFVWGFLPCGMVYAALLYAMLSGSPLAGGMIMAGFGLGTLPAVLASAMGARQLLAWSHDPKMRTLIGLSIAGLAFASAALPWKAIAALCGFPVE